MARIKGGVGLLIVIGVVVAVVAGVSEDAPPSAGVAPTATAVAGERAGEEAAEPDEEPTPTTPDEEPVEEDAPSEEPTPEASPPGAAAGAQTALAVLGTLEIKGRAPKTGYDRDQFGPAWADVDRNGCDTRNDILARDLTDRTFKAGTHDCVVLTGTLADPYTALRIAFQRGQHTSTAVQIDHVVALSDAWQKGAQLLDPQVRRDFANDPINLLAVDGPTNQAKGDGDAATWLPPNKSFRCDYVARQVAVKSSYALWVTQAEHDAIARVLDTCPEQPLPAASGALTSAIRTGDAEPTTAAEPTPAPEPTPAAEPEPTAEPTPDAASVFYQNCAAVRAAGAAPILEGEPGYSRKLDRDGDGIGCE